MPLDRINGVELYWESNGSGPGLVLVHGSWGDHYSWMPVVQPLAESFTVVTYDRRGHSQSERPAGQGSILEDAADLGALIEHLELAPAFVVGNSFGGSVALRLAETRPELLSALSVHEPPLFDLVTDVPAARQVLEETHRRQQAVIAALERGRIEEGARLFIETMAFGPGAWDRMPPPIRATCVQNAPTWLDETRDRDAYTLDLAALGRFAAPCLLTQGDQSLPHFAAVVAKLEESIPAATRLVFPGAGHVPQMSHPQDFVAVLTRFHDEQVGGARA